MKIALIGNPNSGKTTLFNALTGHYQFVGNWPQVTVEKKSGYYRKDKSVEIIDLPGVYSLSPYTSEEIITRNYLLNEKPDLVINIVDATNLERNLYLTLQVLETDVPVIIALNFKDVLEKRGITIDKSVLEENLKVRVVEISALTGLGIESLMEEVKIPQKKTALKIFNPQIETIIDEIEKSINFNHKRFYAIKLLEGDDKFEKEIKVNVEDYRKEIESKENTDIDTVMVNGRYEYIQENLSKAISGKKLKYAISTSDKIDKVLTNKFLGLPIFLAIMWFIYYISISTIGDYGIGLMEDIFGRLGETVGGFLGSIGASEGVISLISDGIIGGVGAIFTFVPQMLLMFFFLAILEDSGYMARIAFIMDKIFRKFGLSGKSFIPMLIGTGCSIPGVMATRTIENDADKRMTILLTPFVPCGAKLPVFAMFIALVFNGASWIGPFIYLFAMAIIIISGIILKKTERFKGDPAPFVMELPEYRLPSIKNIGLYMLEKAMSFIRKAGSIILVCNVLLWILQNFNASFQYIPDDIEHSMLAGLGNFIKPLFIPLGFGDSWAQSVASITGFAAKEVVVSTFATVGSKIPIYFTPVTAMSFIILTMFAPPCFAAIGAMRRELGNLKDLGFTLFFQLSVAYVLSMITNLVGNALFKGTPLTEPMPISYEQIEKAEEFGDYAILQGDIVSIVFMGLVAIFILIGIWNTMKKNAGKYA